MSHFSILVIGDNVENQLLPYQESTEDRRFLEFQDVEEYKKEYKLSELPVYWQFGKGER